MVAVVDGQIVNVKSVSHRHEAIVDLMLMHPGRSKAWIAQELGFTGPWLSTVTNSEAFKEYYLKRREAVNSSKLGEIFDRQLRVAAKAYEKVEEYLDQGEGLDPGLVFNMAQATAGAVGLGPKKMTMTVEKESTLEHSIDQDTLARARERMRKTITYEG